MFFPSETDSHWAGREIPRRLWNQNDPNVFVRVRHWAPSWASFIQLAPAHTLSLRSILILSCDLCLRVSSRLFPSRSPADTLYRVFISAICMLHVPPFSPSLTWLSKSLKIMVGMFGGCLQDLPTDCEQWQTTETRSLLLCGGTPVCKSHLSAPPRWNPVSVARAPVTQHNSTMTDCILVELKQCCESCMDGVHTCTLCKC